MNDPPSAPALESDLAMLDLYYAATLLQYLVSYEQIQIHVEQSFRKRAGIFS